MNERKQHVIKMAHQLFISKGFQATSIQDILDYSGISKGTFYHYFTSKNELFIAIVKSVTQKIEKERNDLLIGQDPANIEIFIKQLELQLSTNRKMKLVALFEEVTFSGDQELADFFKRGQLMMLKWVYTRFVDIFGRSKEACLLDCAIMFIGILFKNLYYYDLAHETNSGINRVVCYSVDRITKLVEEVASSGDYLIQPEFLNKWLPDCHHSRQTFHQSLFQTILELKHHLCINEDHSKYVELLDFLLDELLHTENPRKFLIESVLSSLRMAQGVLGEREFQKLDRLIKAYFIQLEQTDLSHFD